MQEQNEQTAPDKDASVTPIFGKRDQKKVDLIHRVMHSQLSVIKIFPEEYTGITVLLNWTKSLFDKNTKMMIPQGADNLQLLKIAHDNYATIAHLLSTRCQDKHMNLEPIVEAIAYAKEMATSIKTEVEKIEPPKQTDKKTYEMDLSHVKAEAKSDNSENQSN